MKVDTLTGINILGTLYRVVILPYEELTKRSASYHLTTLKELLIPEVMKGVNFNITEYDQDQNLRDLIFKAYIYESGFLWDIDFIPFVNNFDAFKHWCIKNMPKIINLYKQLGIEED